MAENSSQFTRRQMLGALGIGAATPLLLAACSGPGASTGGGGGGGQLSQWYHQYGEEGTKQAAFKYAAAYKKNPIKVNWVSGDYASKLNTRLLAGSGVDIFENNAINIADARAGRYADLTDIMEPIKDKYNPAVLDNVTIDGKIWGIPMIIDPQGFYYSKSAFKDAGIKVPETMEDLYNAVKKLSSGGKKGIFLSNTDGGAGLWASTIWATGSELFNSDNTKAGWTDNIDAVAESYSFLQKIQQGKMGLQGQPSDWWDITPFAQKKVPIQWGGMWSVPQAVKALGDDVGVFAMPGSGDKATKAVILGGWNQQVAAKSTDVKASKAFAKWLWVDQKKDQEDWSLSYGFHIPPITEVAASATKLQSGPGKEFVDLFTKYGKAQGPYVTSAVGTAMGDAGTAIIINNKDPKSTLQDAAKKVEAALAQIK